VDAEQAHRLDGVAQPVDLDQRRAEGGRAEEGPAHERAAPRAGERARAKTISAARPWRTERRAARTLKKVDCSVMIVSQ
jgi:hypothetical protein